MNSMVLRKHLLTLRVLQSQSLSTIKQTFPRNSSKANPVTKEESSRWQYKKSYRDKHLNNNTEKLKVNDSDIKFSQFLSSSQNDPDNFGTLSEDWKMHQRLKDMPEEEGDVLNTEFLNNRQGKRRLTTNQYGRIIKKFLAQKKIGHAIDVLETRMLKEDRVKPESYIYNLIITACGEVGYVKKAFNLYKRMRVSQVKVTGHTYTALFNALANSPYPEDALNRVHHLRAALQERGVLMNHIIYHAMIKVYGRCGDIDTAFMLVDEMLEKKIFVTSETFNFLLQACITNKAAGFRHALMVWWKMKQRRVWPDLYTFNLMLRCCRDCGLGDEMTTWQVTQVILQHGQKREEKKLEPGECTKENQNLSVSNLNLSEDLPNLICRKPTMGNIVAVKNITSPKDRLVLMGGTRGVLEEMSLHNVMPDIKTFAHLLDQIPSTLTDEQNLLHAMEHAKVRVDLDFYNMLIKKRCLRKDYDNAKEVLKMIQAENFRPNIVTFGVLAMTCQTVTSARQLLEDIQNIGYRPNVEILGALLKTACFTRDCDYVMEMMKTIKGEGIMPSEKFLNHLDNFYRFATDALSNKETDDTGVLKRDRFEVYRKYYRSWRRDMNPEEEPHPWNQYIEFPTDPEDITLKNQEKIKYVPD